MLKTAHDTDLRRIALVAEVQGWIATGWNRGAE